MFVTDNTLAIQFILYLTRDFVCGYMPTAVPFGTRLAFRQRNVILMPPIFRSTNRFVSCTLKGTQTPKAWHDRKYSSCILNNLIPAEYIC